MAIASPVRGKRETEQYHQRLMQENADRQDEVTLDVLGLFLRLLDRWYVIVAAALVGAMISGVWSFFFMTPVYEATTKLYVVSSKDSAINLSDLQIGNYLASDYQEVFSNWHVHEMVINRLGLEYSYSELSDMIEVTNPSDTRILYIQVTSTDPAEAQAMANTYAEVAQEFIAVKMETDEPNIFEEARLPIHPSAPNKTRNVILGFLAGAFLACAVIACRFIMDDRIRTADDIERYIGLPTLGVVTQQKKPVRARRAGKA